MKRALAWLSVLVLAIVFISSCGGGAGGGTSHNTLSKEDIIVMLGNSITHRTDWSAKMPNNTMVNLGVDGARTSHMLGRLNAALSYGPKVLCVMGGINDLIAHVSVNSVYNNLEQILLRAKAAGVMVIMESTLMVGIEYPHAGTLNPQVLELNGRLSALASAQGERYMDLNARLSNGSEMLEEYDSGDHLHINDEAYNVWATLLDNTLP